MTRVCCVATVAAEAAADVHGGPDAGERLKHACNRLAQICERSHKPVAVVLGATETNNSEHRAIVDDVRDDFAARGIAVYPSVERAAFALGRLAG